MSQNDTKSILPTAFLLIHFRVLLASFFEMNTNDLAQAKLKNKWPVKLFVDCRTDPSATHITLSSLEQAFPQLSEYETLFCINNPSDEIFLPKNRFASHVVCGGDVQWLDIKRFIDLGSDTHCLLFVESGLFVDVTGAKALANLVNDKSFQKAKQPVCILPSHVYFKGEKTVIEHDLKGLLDKNTNPLRTPAPLFGLISPFDSQVNLMGDPLVIHNVVESVFQYFYENNFKLKAEKKFRCFAKKWSSAAGLFQGTPQSCNFAISVSHFEAAARGLDSPTAPYLLLKPLAQLSSNKRRATEQEQALFKSAGQIDPMWNRRTSDLPTTIESGNLQTNHWEFEVVLQGLQSLESCEYVFILHQLRRGGSEREALAQIAALNKLHGNPPIGVLLTSPVGHDWTYLLPPNVRVLHWGRSLMQYQGFPQQWNTRHALLSILIRMIKPSYLHLTGSQEGWNCIIEHGRTLSSCTSIIGSVYCLDFDTTDFPQENSCTWADRAAPFLDWILADNQKVIDQMNLAPDTLKKAVIYYPAFSIDQPEPKNLHKSLLKKPAKLKGCKRFLWASRICRQKDINALLVIAWLFPECTFHAFGELSEDAAVPPPLENLEIHEGFDDIIDLPIADYDAFLYTSIWDGLPNILVEIGSFGLPIIARNSGGIRELLNDHNSYIGESVEELIECVEDFLASPNTALKKATKLKKAIEERHNWTTFIDKISTIYETKI